MELKSEKMEIQILTSKNKTELENKAVYCWGYVAGNLKELCKEFAVADKVTAILEDNPKWQGNFFKTGDATEAIPVVTPEILHQIKEESAIIITADYPQEVLERIEQNNYLQGKSCRLFRFVNQLEQIDLQYRAQYKETPLENIIIFRSGPYRKDYVRGTDFWDNSRALFEYMLEQGYNQKYKLVWLVKNPLEFKRYDGVHNVEFLSFDWEDSENREERDRYYHALCLAKYIFTTDAYGFAKNARADQVRIQLWHGCGFKTRNNFIRCEKRYDYTTVVSDLYADIHADIYGLRKDQVLITGYAKHDWLFQPYDEDLSEVLGITKASNYVFWLPTFRIADDSISSLNQYEINPETGLPIVANRKQMIQLNELLKSMDITLVVKLHPLQKNVLVKDYQCSNIAIFRHVDLLESGLAINRLLASASAMISDYSSAAVDFLVLDRPLAFTLDDVEEYENSRGFVFDNIKEWLPGREVFDFNDFCTFLREVAAGQDISAQKRQRISEKLLQYKDNQNCRRILEAFGIEK